MTLSTSSHLARRARLARTVSPAALSSAAALAAARHRQQERSFRFGRLWTSYFEADRENCRRSRRFRYKYIESPNRRSTWDDHPLAREHKATLKRTIHNTGDEKDSQLGSSRGKLEKQKTLENSEGARPGQNIEDAERAPMEHLLFGERKPGSETYEYDYWQSPIQNLKNKLRSRLAKATIPDAATEKISTHHPEDYIDPVTNRRATKSPESDIPLRTFKAYRSRFSPPEHPIDPEAESGSQANDAARRIYWHQQSDLGTWSRGSNSFRGRGLRGMFGAEPPKYDDLAKYKPTVVETKQDSAGDFPLYNDLHKYGAFRSHEPDGKYKAESQESGTLQQENMSPNNGNAEELGKYHSFRSHEPDGRYKDQLWSSDFSVDEAELEKYQAFRSHEPDGKYKFDSEDLWAEENKSHKYSAVRSHEPDGKYKAHVESVDAFYDPEELAQYEAMRAHEPDGKYKTQTSDAEEPYDPEELARYDAFRAHEPDGKYKVDNPVSHEQYDPEELARYGAFRAHEPDGRYKREAEQAHLDIEKDHCDPEDLKRYGAFRAHEPDGMYKREAEKAQFEIENDHSNPEELKDYGAFRSHEPDGKYKREADEADVEITNDHGNPDELGTYTAYRSHEPDGMYAARQRSQIREGDGSRKCGAYRSHEPDGKYAEERAGEEVGPEDLASYGAYRSHEPDGKYADQTTECTDFKDSAPPVIPNRLDPEEVQEYQAVDHNEPDGISSSVSENNQYTAELERYGALEWNKPDGNAVSTEKTNYQKLLEDLLPEHASLTQSATSPSADQAQKLTGNYARDFPEEFTAKWSTENSAEESSTLLPEDIKDRIDRLTDQVHELNLAGNASQSDSAIQPALDRQLKPGRLLSSQSQRGTPEELYPYSKTPMGLETAYAEECGGKEPGLTLVKVYDSLKDPTSNEAVSKTPVTPEQQPTLYKILAYDPTMQAINVAETTSIVPDSASPLTPAEVLLRLSNPAKFFPHFGPLQKQGYEIVSGSGDVLIFRKVRPGNFVATSDVEVSSAASTEACSPADMKPADSAPGAAVSSPVVNPVDMTGRNPATRFASPTGFVNYNYPPAPSEPFVSGIDVRREEDVFSGPKESQKQKEKKKRMSMPKRMLVSAAWVGGVSYAIGVVSEYFKTGGSDGKGQKSF